MAANFLVADHARDDLDTILETSESRWGPVARERYAKLVVAAFTAIIQSPTGPTSQHHPEIEADLWSLHLDRVRRRGDVRNPVHVVYYRVTVSTIEVARILHDHMDAAAAFAE